MHRLDSRSAIVLLTLILGATLPLRQLQAKGPRGLDIQKISDDLKQVNTRLQAPCSNCEVNSPPASDDGLCSDLYRFTCAPGEYHDGTGSASTSGAAEIKMAQVRDKAKPVFSQRFEAALKNPENEYFRQTALSALGLTFSPACEGGKRSRDCDALIVQGLNELAMRRIFPTPSGGGFGFASLRDIDLLLLNPMYQEVERTLTGYARSQLQDQGTIDKIRNTVFPDVQKIVAKVIGDSIVDPKIKQILTTKVNAIRFEGTECSQLTMTGLPSANDPSVSALLVPNAYYDSVKNTFRYCNGFLLRSQSEFQIASVIAHELGHSIDPCNISKGPRDFSFKYPSPKNAKKSEAEYPFPGLISCLRSEKSIAAKAPRQEPPRSRAPDEGESKSPAPPEAPKGDGSDEPEAEMRPKTSPMESPFCNGDQIGESFSDWLAAEVLPEYIAKKHPNLTRNQMRIGYSNVWRGNCNNVDPASGYHSSGDVHSSIEDRVNKIILVHPKVRQQMGCPTQPDVNSTYCSGKKGNTP